MLNESAMKWIKLRNEGRVKVGNIESGGITHGDVGMDEDQKN